MAIVGLETTGQESQAGRPAENRLIEEILTGHSPVFFHAVDTYAEIVEAAAAAREGLRQLADFSQPTNDFIHNKEREYYLEHARTEPEDPRVVAYERFVERDRLQELVYCEDDVNSLIRKEGNAIVEQLKATLTYSPHIIGNNLYFLQYHPDQEVYPGRVQFYRVDDMATFGEEEVTFPEFGESLRYRVEPPFRRAAPSDIVLLVNDMHASINTSQPT